MLCYIRTLDGLPLGNPITEENMLQAFPEIDLLNLPEGWAPFLRVTRPDDLPTGPFKVDVCSYALSLDGVTWQDEWASRDMTPEEKAERIEKAQANPSSAPNLSLDLETLRWVPATPKPVDGNRYRWDYEVGEWVIVTT